MRNVDIAYAEIAKLIQGAGAEIHQWKSFKRETSLHSREELVSHLRSDRSIDQYQLAEISSHILHSTGSAVILT
jgi:hypothetical protein